MFSVPLDDDICGVPAFYFHAVKRTELPVVRFRIRCIGKLFGIPDGL